METLTCNLSQRVRRVSENGRDYLVAPATLLKEGVLPGSQGPLLYLSDEIEQTAHQWNGIPITVFHPVSPEGYNLSARVPGVLDAQGIGEVRNARYHRHAKKLQADLWFDERRTRQLDPGVYNSLLSQSPIPLSTGLFTRNEPAYNANYNGTPYVATARGYRADHVAVLPRGERAACHLDDGCGVLISNRAYAGCRASYRASDWQVVVNARIHPHIWERWWRYGRWLTNLP